MASNDFKSWWMVPLGTVIGVALMAWTLQLSLNSSTSQTPTPEQQGSFVTPSPVAAPAITPAPGWNAVSDNLHGFAYAVPSDQDEMPTSFVVQFVASGSLEINGDGCYVPAGQFIASTTVMVDGTLYCVSNAGEGAMGHVYQSYAFSTPVNGGYLILQYTTEETNCGVYEPDEASQTECKTRNQEATEGNKRLFDAILETVTITRT